MRWLFMLPLLIVGIVIAITVYLQPNDFMACGKQPAADTQCGKADAIVVVSGGDTQARTAAGIGLYKQGWADYLVFSGAAYDKSGPSNAAAMRSQAEAQGVPSDVILVDEQATNTQQNAQNTKSIFTQHNFTNIILVTSGYHQRRASLEFNKMATGVTIRNYPVTQDNDWGWSWWATPRGWWLAGGELIKIVAFYIGTAL